jgi:hypothetical protein
MIQGAPTLTPEAIIAIEASKDATLPSSAKPQLGGVFGAIFDDNGNVMWAPDGPPAPAPHDRWKDFNAAVTGLGDPWPQTLRAYVPKYVDYLIALKRQKAPTGAPGASAGDLSKAKARQNVGGSGKGSENASKPADDPSSIWPIPLAPDGRPLNRPPPVTSAS